MIRTTWFGNADCACVLNELNVPHVATAAPAAKWCYERCAHNYLFLNDKLKIRSKLRGIKTKDNNNSARPKGRGIGPEEIKLLSARAIYSACRYHS